MILNSLSEWFGLNQELLWFTTIAVDLGFAILLYRLFGRQGLYASIIISLLLANLQGPKLTEIFGLQTSMGVILYSSIYFATDLLSERYGKEEATRAVMIGFTVSVIIIVMISISLFYLPASSPETAELAQSMHTATATLFDFTPRFVLGSLLAYLISQRFDVWIFHQIKHQTKGRHLWLRNNVSTLCSQALDTIIYGLVVWWGVVDFATAMQLALAKYFFKVMIALIDTPFIYLAREWNMGNRDWVTGTENIQRSAV
ncbi:MAG: queuosine precursor transporter [Gammaproteobacteria bacterium]|nr:queuosine precursor transporter [Gammaproteobacteria bacterium]